MNVQVCDASSNFKNGATISDDMKTRVASI